MEQKKRLTLLWRKLNTLELGKDVVLVPYYLGQALGFQTEICCGYDEDIIPQINNTQKEDLKFIKLNLGHNPFSRIPIYIKYLVHHASHIDFLMCFHWRLETFINILFYKLFNKNGLIYVKLDTEFGKEWDLSRCSFFGKIIRKKLYTLCLKRVDILSCETSQPFYALTHNKDFGHILSNKLVLMPNAFDEKQLKTSTIIERSYQQKENLMITVGRLGTDQKNTEMLLNALKNTDLKEWKFCLIGPIEEEFRPIIELFYDRYPEKKSQVFFTGKIDDKKELWEWYNKSKVFVSTSRWESYGLVLIEAKRFKNYMVCTPVGAAEDLLEQERYGSLIEQENDNDLKKILSKIVNGELDTDVYHNYDSLQLSYQRSTDILMDFLRKKILPEKLRHVK